MTSVTKKPASSAGVLGILAVLLSATFFGLNAVASKKLFAAPALFDPTALFVARGFWTLPLFLILALVTRPRPFPPLTAKAGWLFLLCAVTYGPGTNALSALGAGNTSASHAILLLSLFPPLAAFLAAVALGEKLTVQAIAAIVIGIAGALVLTFSKSAAGSSWAGDAMIGGFIFTWALLTLGIRELDSTYPALFVVGVFGTIGSLLLIGMGAGLGQLDAVLVPLHHFDMRMIVWFDLELIVLLSLGGQLLQGAALRTLNVAIVVALTSYGSIFAGIAASMLVLGEHLTTGEIVAGAILILALGLSLAPKAWFGKYGRTGTHPIPHRKTA